MSHATASPVLEHRSTDPTQLATDWLDRLTDALETRNSEALRQLFRADAFWRDLVALSGFIRTVTGREAVAQTLASASAQVKPHSFALAPDNTAPSVQRRGAEQVVEAFFDFETVGINGKGVVRLVPADSGQGAVATGFLTVARELKGSELPVGDRRIKHAVPHRFGGSNWKDTMLELKAFEGRDPEVVVIGAGQSGLCVASSLRLMGIDVLTLEQNGKVGDNWRNRYHSLTLHGLISTVHMPHMPYPETWPEYIPKDKFGGWLEAYSNSMEVPVWTNTSFLGGSRDPETGMWTLRIERDGKPAELRAKHVVMATGGGICGIPNIPNMPGAEDFQGQALHAAQIGDVKEFAGKPVLVVGSATSAHDLAAELVGLGADVTMVQRNPTHVVQLDTANLASALYQQRPSDECDLINQAISVTTMKKDLIEFTQFAVDQDRELIEKLESAGFKTDLGLDDAGFLWGFQQRGGGYYINVGGSDLIADGKIKVVQSDDIETLTPAGWRSVDGTEHAATAVIFATGYANQSDELRVFFGNEVADQVGPVWGYGEDGELRNMWRPIAAKNLWLTSGGIQHARSYGNLVALQIKARLDGRIDGQDLSTSTMWV